MNQPNCVELAKQGNPKAIAALMNQALQTKGITARATAKDGCLYLTLESEKALKEEICVEWVQKGLRKLDISSIQRVKLYGQKAGESLPNWSQQYEISDSNDADKKTSLTPKPELQHASQNDAIDRAEKSSVQFNIQPSIQKSDFDIAIEKVETNFNLALSAIDEFSDRAKSNYKQGGLKQVYSGISKKELAVIVGISLCLLYFFSKSPNSQSQPQIAALRPSAAVSMPTAMPIPAPEQLEFSSQSSIEIEDNERIDFLRKFDGQLHLVSQDNEYLGLLSSDVYEPDSICNPHGTYGSNYSYTSIHNNFSSHGSEFSSDSPYNEHGQSPPVIVLKGQQIAIVTRNNYLSSKLPKIDPSELLFAYQCYQY